MKKSITILALFMLMTILTSFKAPSEIGGVKTTGQDFTSEIGGVKTTGQDFTSEIGGVKTTGQD